MAKRTEPRMGNSYIRGASGNLIPLTSLSDSQLQDFRQRAVERMGKALGEYFSLHPDELEDFSRCEGVTVIREVAAT